MIQPRELKKDEPLLWSTGRGTDVWDMFRASASGDLVTVKRLLRKDPSLVRAAYAYRRPMYFAVRENQLEVAELLIENGADPVNAWGSDTLLDIARDRGHTEMLTLLEKALSSAHERPKERLSPQRSASAICRKCGLCSRRRPIFSTPPICTAISQFTGQR